MGDRCNIIVKDGESTVYLYSHWDGYRIADILKSALKRKLRWNDGSYLTRIIFEEMIKDSIGSETGYGISAVYGDGGNDITVDVDQQTVNGQNINDVSFSDFISS